MTKRLVVFLRFLQKAHLLSQVTVATSNILDLITSHTWRNFLILLLILAGRQLKIQTQVIHIKQPFQNGHVSNNRLLICHVSNIRFSWPWTQYLKFEIAVYKFFEFAMLRGSVFKSWKFHVQNIVSKIEMFRLDILLYFLLPYVRSFYYVEMLFSNFCVQNIRKYTYDLYNSLS